MSDTPVFGRYEKVVLLLLGFALTTVGGALLGSYLQTRSRFKTQQEQVFTEVARLMDMRAFRTEQLLKGFLGDLEYADLPSRKTGYRLALEEWNINRNRNSALVERYFGRTAQQCFARIHVNFLNVNLSIRRGADYLTIIKEDLERLQAQVHAFDLYLLRMTNARLFSRPPPPCRVPVIPPRLPAQAASDSSAAAAP